jgi:hypothetical protein
MMTACASCPFVGFLQGENIRRWACNSVHEELSGGANVFSDGYSALKWKI